jgi:hypothetical protein
MEVKKKIKIPAKASSPKKGKGKGKTEMDESCDKGIYQSGAMLKASHNPSFDMTRW